jgi:hypothetical protein
LLVGCLLLACYSMRHSWVVHGAECVVLSERHAAASLICVRFVGCWVLDSSRLVPALAVQAPRHRARLCPPRLLRSSESEPPRFGCCICILLRAHSRVLLRTCCAALC